MPNYLFIEIQNQSLVTRQCFVRRQRCCWQSAQWLRSEVDLTYPSNLQAEVLAEFARQWRRVYKTTVMSVAVALPQSYLWENPLNHPDQLSPHQCFAYVAYQMRQVMQEQNMALAWDYSTSANQPLIVLAIAQSVLQFFQQLCACHRCQLKLLTSEQQAVQCWGQSRLADEIVIGQQCGDGLKLFYLAQRVVRHQQLFNVEHVDEFITAMTQFYQAVPRGQPQCWITGDVKKIQSWIQQWQQQSRAPTLMEDVQASGSFISQGLFMGMRAGD